MKKFLSFFLCILVGFSIVSCSDSSEESPLEPESPAKNVTLSFLKNSDSATGSMSSISGSSGDTVKIPDCSFTNSGYTFIAWNTTADGSGTSYSVNDNFVLPLSNLGLYAQWQIESGNQDSNQGHSSQDNNKWAGEGWYAFIYNSYWYIAKFDAEKNLISKNRSGETAYEYVSLSYSYTWPKSFTTPVKTDKTSWDLFKTLQTSWTEIRKITDSQMEESLINVLWLFNEKNLEENSIYHAVYSNNEFYFLFNGTDFESSKSDFAYTTYRSNSNDPVDEFIYYYNSSSFYPYIPERLITSGYNDFRKVMDENLPEEILRAFRLSSETNKNYKYSYAMPDNTTYTCYARFNSSGFSTIVVSIDNNQNYMPEYSVSYKEVAAYKNFCIVSDDDLPLKIKNVFIEPERSTIYKYTDADKEYYAKTCSSSYSAYQANMATIIYCDTQSSLISVPEDPASNWFNFAINATSEISTLTYSDVSDEINSLLDGAPNTSDLYTFTDASGNTVYTKFGAYMDMNYNYCYRYGMIKNKDTGKYSPITQKKITDWPVACLIPDFKKITDYTEIDNLVKYYTETGLKAGHDVTSTVFKFFENEGTSYYAYYSIGRVYYPYLAKTSDGESFIKVEDSELDSLGLPYYFNEIVFLDDFEPTNIDTDKIRNAN